MAGMWPWSKPAKLADPESRSKRLEEIENRLAVVEAKAYDTWLEVMDKAEKIGVRLMGREKKRDVEPEPAVRTPRVTVFGRRE